MNNVPEWAVKAAEEAITDKEIQPFVHQLVVVGEHASTQAFAEAESPSEVAALCRVYQNRLAEIIAKHAPETVSQLWSQPEVRELVEASRTLADMGNPCPNEDCTCHVAWNNVRRALEPFK